MHGRSGKKGRKKDPDPHPHPHPIPIPISQAQYDECVQNLRAFRSYHLGAATKYLVRTTKGTGTSTFRDLLKEMIVNTNEAMIGGGDGESSR